MSPPAGNPRPRGAPIEQVRADAWTIPTDAPEADGTFAWDSTTLVTARVAACGRMGLGYTYGHRAIVTVIADTLAPLACGSDALDIPARRSEAVAALRNIGHPGLGAMAVSALDVALWDLKAQLLEVPLADLMGLAQPGVAVYGSGGFTTYDDQRLGAQLAGWTDEGIARVKMKVGSEPTRDPQRVRSARRAIGPDTGLMVDANGAYDAAQALALGEAFAGEGVDWYEEPLSSDHLDGLAALRTRLPPGLELAAGEYGWDPHYFLRLLQARAVDVLQADATRCGGYTGFLEAAQIARAHHVPLSAHCAPALHLPACAAAGNVRHIEWFHDHVRIESMAFDGAPRPVDGMLAPQRERPGHGLVLREADLEAYRV